MRPHVLLFVLIFAFVVFSVFGSVTQRSADEEALIFLKRVSSGDVSNALREFGDNSCHCAPKGGYIAYLEYAYGAEPNIAFLVGEPFQVNGKIEVNDLPNKDPYFVPWDKPEDKQVVVPIEFPKGKEPYLVPLDSAFGWQISEKDLKDFETDPAKDANKGITLRLRDALGAGVVGKIDTSNPEWKEDKDAEKNIPPELLKYLHPKDVGAVKEDNGTVVALAQKASELPRLRSIKIHLKIVRRGAFHRWAIHKIAVSNPVLLSNGKEIPLD